MMIGSNLEYNYVCMSFWIRLAEIITSITIVALSQIYFPALTCRAFEVNGSFLSVTYWLTGNWTSIP